MKRFTSVLCLVFLLFICAVPAFSAQPDRIRIGVLDFESKADGVTQQQAEIITDIFTRQLASSRTIAVYERHQLAKIGAEIKLGMSGLVDINTAVEVGRIAGVQYILLGAVTGLNQKTSGGIIPIPIGFGLAVATGSNEVQATIDARLIDVATSQTRLAISETGSSSSSASGVSFAGLSYAEVEGFGGLEARAIEDATGRLAHRIREVVGGESSHVVSLTGNGVIIDVGSTMGAKEGALFLVYADGKSIFGMHGEVIGRERINLAIIKINEVSNSHSTCSVVPQGGELSMIRRGDKIEPIASRAAKNVKFASSRPAASSETFNQLFGGGGDPNTTQPAYTANTTDNRLAEIAGSSSSLPPDVTTQTPLAQAPTSIQPQQGGRRDIPGFDPDTSTDSKVISTYGIDTGLANMLSIKHRTAYNKFNSKRYKEAYEDFKSLVDDYKGNYLSAYWAGRAAHSLRKNDESLEWMEFALAINPNYKPAADFKKNTLKK